MNNKFIISTDSCVDRFKSYLDKNEVYCVKLKRITNGVEQSELYDSAEEFEAFYDSIKKGALPTTSQLNPYDVEEHFKQIIEQNPTGDIIHVSLSGGLSSTFSNCKLVAEEFNRTFTDRRFYAIDSLSASLGMAMLVDRLIEYRDSGMDSHEAVAKIEHLREHQQVWAIVGNLFHLRRGGRLSGFKAIVGSLLSVKPILVINDKGKLGVESSQKGLKKSIDYVVNKMERLGKNKGIDYNKSAVYIMHSAAYAELQLLREALVARFGDISIREGIIGPIIGTHVGEGAIALIFEGDKRLT